MSNLFQLVNDDSGNITAISPKNAKSTESQRYSSPDVGKPGSQPQAKTVSAESSNAPGSSGVIIDVVKDYDWKVSPNNEIVEQPYLLLKEYYVDKSSLAAQALYQLQATVESMFKTFDIIATRTPISDFIKNATQPDPNFIGPPREPPKDIVSVLNELRLGAEANIDELKAFIGHEGDIQKNGIIDPYVGLYILRKTDFTYKIPYFSSKHTQKSSTWDSNYSGAGQNLVTELMGRGVDFVASFGTGIPIFGSLFEPGLYIERGKFYQPLPGAETVSVSFPLLNTLNEESIQKNFDLIWLLVYQNSSFRKNKTEVRPPCLYQVLIPGIKFILYAYISDISIEYLGTRRKISLRHPKTSARVDTIVPEAYNLRITLRSMTTDSGNFMLQSLRDTL